MKMNKSLIALCLSAGLLASAPGISLADVNYVPQNTSDAPAIPSAALQQLTWTPVDQSKTQTTQLSTGGQQLNVPGISGPVAAYSVPANIGELTLTLTSEVNKQTSVFAPNVLILDEPTNDLDLATLNILEDYLDSFQGAIIAVSHDRYFLDRITTHLFAVEDAHMVPYIGGYQSYLDAQEAKAEAMADMKQTAAAKPKDTRVRVQTQLKFSYKEQRDFDTIENRVAELEEKLAQLEQEIAANASDYTKVTELMDTQAKTQQELDEATERWLFLQEKWEQIQAQKG